MEEKIKKALCKNFDKTWEKLTNSQKIEVVNFMKESLIKAEKSWKEDYLKRKEYQVQIADKLKDDEIYHEMLNNMRVAPFVIKKCLKEEDLQEKILNGTDRQLLFKDIVLTDNNIEKSKEITDKLCKKIKELLLLDKKMALTFKYAQIFNANYVVEQHYNSLTNQLKKVDELFSEIIKSEDMQK